MTSPPKPDSPDGIAAATAQINATLERLPADQREALEGLRSTIAAAAPEAVEAISYGMPAFRYSGRPLVGYNAAKAHCALYPMDPAVIDAHREELAGFDTAKGTIRFSPGSPLSPELMTAIVRRRMRDIDAAADRGRTKTP